MLRPRSQSVFATPLVAGLLCVAAATLPASAQVGAASAGAAKSDGNTAARRGSAAAPAKMNSQDLARLSRALGDYTAGRLNEARPVLLDLANRYPAVLDAQTATGMLLAEQGELAKAVPYLQHAHRLSPGDTAIATNLGIALIKLQRGTEAVPVLQDVCRRQPKDAAARLALAQALLSAKRYDEAANTFQQASSLAATGDGVDLDDLRYSWGVALIQAGHSDRAVKVLAETPNAATSAPVQELLGEASEKSGHYQEAFTHLKRAVELDPSEANLYAYGSEMLQHWTFPAAIEIFRYATGRYPASKRLQTALGVAYFGNNNFAESARVFESMLAADPDNTAIADLLGRSCAAQTGTAQGGCSTLVTFAEAHPANAPASLYAAISILHQSADPQGNARAEALLRSALKADPKLPEAWYQLATLQQGRAEWDASEASLLRAVALRPAYPEAHYRLSRAYAHTGKRDQAQQQIALQQQYTQQAKDAETSRMKEVMTFLTTSN